MDESEVIEVAREAINITIEIGAPILLIGLFVGVAIALIQALTQVQEMTLVFVPKILAIFLAFSFFLPTMMGTLVKFMRDLLNIAINLG